MSPCWVDDLTPMQCRSWLLRSGTPGRRQRRRCHTQRAAPRPAIAPRLEAIRACGAATHGLCACLGAAMHGYALVCVPTVASMDRYMHSHRLVQYLHATSACESPFSLPLCTHRWEGEARPSGDPVHVGLIAAAGLGIKGGMQGPVHLSGGARACVRWCKDVCVLTDACRGMC